MTEETTNKMADSTENEEKTNESKSEEIERSKEETAESQPTDSIESKNDNTVKDDSMDTEVNKDEDRNSDPVKSKEKDKKEENNEEDREKNSTGASKAKEEEDDVPGDFFDDFLKEDFMAGLDIVDEESEDATKSLDKPKGKKVIINRRVSTEIKKPHPKKIDHVKKFRESPPDKNSKSSSNSKYKPRSEEIKDELRELDAQLEHIRKKKPPLKARLGDIEPDAFDISHRRDPEKVKRDIQIDKQRCERKLITDIVETGLVPPGMELEVEFNDVRRQVRIDKNKPPGDLRDVLRSRRSRSHEKKKDRKSRTPVEKRRRSRTPKERRKRSATPKERRKKSRTPEKEKSNKPLTPESTEKKPESVKENEKNDKKEEKSPKNSPKSPKQTTKSPSRKSAKSPSHRLSKSPRRTPPKRRRSKSPLHSEVESLKSSVDEIIDAHLEARRAQRDKAKENEKEVDRRRERSPLVGRKSPGARTSPLLRRSPPLRRSPVLRRSPFQRRSPLLRRRERSPLYRRPNSPSPRRSPRRIRSPRRSRSPSFRRRRRDSSRSPRRSSRRSRSRSPVRPKPTEKKSFLEELAEKLNEPKQMMMPQHPPYMGPPRGPFDGPMGPSMMPMRPLDGPPMMPVIQPVPRGMMNTGPGILGPVPPVGPPIAPAAPPPAQYYPQGPPQVQPPAYDPYDQSFFIGNDPLPSKTFNAPQMQQPMQPMTSPVPNNSQKSASVERRPAEVSKLFEDEKISLSEFLAITAKPQGSSSSSAKLQEKVKVISQCQEAIKILRSNRKFAGPLIIERTNDAPQPSTQKYLSPLLRNPVIQLPFTTPGTRKATTISEYVKFCQSLVYKVGIDKPLPIVTKVAEEPKKVIREVSPEVVYIPNKTKPIIQSVVQFSQIPSKAPTKNIFIQTDPHLAACKECERRKEIGTINTATQVGDPKMTFSVSTQVHESDFYSTIPKSQSLAALTPAQLMGKQLRNLDGRETRGNDPYTRTTPLYEDFPSSRPTYPQRVGGYKPNEDIFPPNPPRFNRSPSPKPHYRDTGATRSLSDTLRASLVSRFQPPPRKY